MDVANLHDNEKILNKNLSQDNYYYYFIIETSFNDKLFFNIEDRYYLLPLSEINVFDPPEKFMENFFKNLKKLSNTGEPQGTQYYLFIIKTYDLLRPEEAKNLGFEDYVFSLYSDGICEDMLNLLSFMSNSYFNFYATSQSFPDFNITSNVNYLEKFLFGKKRESIFKHDLNLGLENLVQKLSQLRREQFKLLEKSLRHYNKALEYSMKYISLGYSMLVSCIEIPAQKYSNAKENFDDFPTNKKIKKIFKKYIKNLMTEAIIGEFLKEVGKSIIDGAYTGITAKFCDFIINKTDKIDNTPESIQSLRSIYYCRSKFLHGGVRFPNNSINAEGYYNEYNKRGKIKRINGNIVIKEIPSFKWVKSIVVDVMNSFIEELVNNIDSKEDIDRYDESDNVDENKIWATAG